MLDAAGCTALRFQDNANHKTKATVGKSGDQDTSNLGGIYTVTQLSRAATDPASERRNHSGTTQVLERRHAGLPPWYWLDVLFEVKSRTKKAAFYFESRPLGNAAESDRKSTRLNSSHSGESRMPSSA